MSTLYAEIVEVADVSPHPNADHLDVVRVKGAVVCARKGEFHQGEKAIYFPPDVCLPEDQAEALGVRQYLRSGGRVAACRLRGQASFGFLAPLDSLPFGANVNDAFGASKFVPPVKVLVGDIEVEHPQFHEYTSIEHHWRFPEAFEPLTLVRITEKRHGTNVRLGYVNGELMVGSHHARRKKGDSVYWRPLADEKLPIRQMLETIGPLHDPMIVFGEIIGPGIQDMDYGLSEPSVEVFDISMNGRYLDWSDVWALCQLYGVRTVPVLYTGPFSPSIVAQHTDGPSQVEGAIRSKFSGREGIVITPLKERYSDAVNGRLILKSVSADYLARKGATDNA